MNCQHIIQIKLLCINYLIIAYFTELRWTAYLITYCRVKMGDELHAYDNRYVIEYNCNAN